MAKYFYSITVSFPHLTSNKKATTNTHFVYEEMGRVQKRVRDRFDENSTHMWLLMCVCVYKILSIPLLGGSAQEMNEQKPTATCVFAETKMMNTFHLIAACKKPTITTSKQIFQF